MGWCSFVLLLMIVMHLGKLTAGSCSCPKNAAEKKRKRILGPKYQPALEIEDDPVWEFFTASLKITTSRKNANGEYILEVCGGALISNKHVLTALHCVVDIDGTGDLYPVDKVQIFFDSEDVDQVSQQAVKLFQGIQFIAAEYLDTTGAPQPRPEYLPNTNNKTLKDDIVVIKLDEDIRQKTKCLLPIPINNDAYETYRNKYKENNKYWIAGWGAHDVNNLTLLSLDLRYTNKLPAMDCPQSDYIQQSTNICFKRTNIDATCNGDSGSPGVVSVNRVWYLQGIHLFGHKKPPHTSPDCNAPESISVDIDVSQYREKLIWIYHTKHNVL